MEEPVGLLALLEVQPEALVLFGRWKVLTEELADQLLTRAAFCVVGFREFLHTDHEQVVRQGQTGGRQKSCSLQQPTTQNNRFKRELLKPEPLNLQPSDCCKSENDGDKTKPEPKAVLAEEPLTIPGSGGTTQSRTISYPKLIGSSRVSSGRSPTDRSSS